MPGFAVTMSIESAPMRDERSASRSVRSPVAPASTWRASRGQLYGATYSVHFAGSVCGAR